LPAVWRGWMTCLSSSRQLACRHRRGAFIDVRTRTRVSPTDSAAVWFLVQVGMFIGFVITYPMNWWLIRHGIKEAM
jgi:hypothetical protein